MPCAIIWVQQDRSQVARPFHKQAGAEWHQPFVKIQLQTFPTNHVHPGVSIHHACYYPSAHFPVQQHNRTQTGLREDAAYCTVEEGLREDAAYCTVEERNASAREHQH
jgi:hypothetical protein